MELITTDKEHLQWIHNRIVEVYGESENVDFLIRMRKIINKQDTELNLHSVSQQRELLLAWEEYCSKLEHITPNYEVLDEWINDFLANNCG